MVVTVTLCPCLLAQVAAILTNVGGALFKIGATRSPGIFLHQKKLLVIAKAERLYSWRAFRSQSLFLKEAKQISRFFSRRSPFTVVAFVSNSNEAEGKLSLTSKFCCQHSCAPHRAEHLVGGLLFHPVPNAIEILDVEVHQEDVDHLHSTR